MPPWSTYSQSGSWPLQTRPPDIASARPSGEGDVASSAAAALSALAACASTGKAPRIAQTKHVNWAAIVGPRDPCTALTEFYADIFGLAPAERQAAQDERLHCIAVARDLRVDNGRPFVSRASLDAALAKLKNGKGSHDGVSAEMLKGLPDAARESLALDLARRCAEL